MQANGHVALALIQKSFQLALDAHAAHRDAARTPRPTIVSGKYLSGFQYRLQIVHGLSLSHEYYVCQRIGLGQAIHLVENLARGELALKSLLASLAEKAIHLATHLGRDTERGAVSVWYIDSLHVLALGGGEKVLHRAVH